ncbi:aminotransferase class I/II-fold pyridoxal phosphate-dependent enzyme [Bradyrhizobium sp. CCBAU 11357]|uniref:aminotransferase class I/II-fold pyridoxal phosphate-dependent enzyme n=1 Tax=Bradyrhizobium sp. CCBAU 11357 TaxID=1630808 RepID=UPI002302E067|nr:aminotransferase class I/II-fold pyridoxal phosphate-dependent enzyme [Bradyrhizobium sp. CCBAU 11357]MDA9497794.1 hypothetical protein [Bradyrhizobium sp. CCBAU 11357]
MMIDAAGRKIISERRGGRIIVNGADTVMLGSNDYLGLSLDERVLAATSEAIKLYGTGTGIYPAFATTVLHEELRQTLASFLQVEDVLLFSSGGCANAGVLTTLAEAGDVIISDRLNHASIIDGCRLSRADVLPYKNRDINDLEVVLRKTTKAHRRLIVTDGVFSMEGGAAPLQEIYALALRYDAQLMVDEAHALGVVGPNGRGTAPFRGLPNGSVGLVLTGSFSKALGGASGGFVAGSNDVVSRLRAHSRSFIFTMGMTTANAAAALAALKICQSDPALLDRLSANLAYLRASFRSHDLPFLDSDSAITALMIGGEDRARRISSTLSGKGVYAPAMIYPVVAEGRARLRIQVSAAHAVADLDHAALLIADLLNDSA